MGFPRLPIAVHALKEESFIKAGDHEEFGVVVIAENLSAFREKLPGFLESAGLLTGDGKVQPDDRNVVLEALEVLKMAFGFRKCFKRFLVPAEEGEGFPEEIG